MNFRHTFTSALAVILLGISAVMCVENARAADNALLPAIPAGQGDTCVENTDFMRRNHMDLLDHQRDKTVLKGARDKEYSLKACLSCHAVNGADSVPLTVASPKHFCRSCHDYVAVSIDCFQCHASRPDSDEPPTDHQLSNLISGKSSVSGSE